MEETFEKIWELCVPYLKKSVAKDHVLHTEGVVEAMKLIIRGEGGDRNIMIPAAMLHDIGWSDVPKDIAASGDKEDRKKSLELHIKYAPRLIRKVLGEAGYPEKDIERIVSIVVSHLSDDPDDKEKKMLIDADALSDSFKKQFYSDAECYGVTPENNYKFRKKNNIFYTETARRIFEKEMAERGKEIFH